MSIDNENSLFKQITKGEIPSSIKEEKNVFIFGTN
jgi:hypothetical protein